MWFISLTFVEKLANWSVDIADETINSHLDFQQIVVENPRPIAHRFSILLRVYAQKSSLYGFRNMTYLITCTVKLPKGVYTSFILMMVCTELTKLGCYF